jgi:hypothetical protein
LMMGNAWHECLPGVRKIVQRTELLEYIGTREWEQPVDRARLALALASLRDSSMELLMLVKTRRQDTQFVERDAKVLCGELSEHIHSIIDQAA